MNKSTKAGVLTVLPLPSWGLWVSQYLKPNRWKETRQTHSKRYHKTTLSLRHRTQSFLSSRQIRANAPPDPDRLVKLGPHAARMKTPRRREASRTKLMHSDQKWVHFFSHTARLNKKTMERCDKCKFVSYSLTVGSASDAVSAMPRGFPFFFT